jgi:prepilin-type N-terminal cleavage/methylation domain-containing protein
MRFASIGTRVASRLFPGNGIRSRAGFTLLEALVALALVLAFAAALGPYLFQARRIIAGADDRIAAQILLRSLLEAPFDRSNPANVSREGENAGLRWRITTEPILTDIMPPERQQKVSSPDERQNYSANKGDWKPFRMVVIVSWGPGLSISAETVRLGKTER